MVQQKKYKLIFYQTKLINKQVREGKAKSRALLATLEGERQNAKRSEYR
jgi:hypothetical protein